MIGNLLKYRMMRIIMMLFKDYSKKSLWNLSLIGLYIILIYLPDITRYKNIVMGLMCATALWYLVRDFRTICRIFTNNLGLALLLLLCAVGYSVFISVDPSLSIKELNKPILNGLLLFSVVIPIVLYQETPRQIANMIMVSFSIGLIVLLLKDDIQYYLEYQNTILPFSYASQHNHREISYGLLFFFPIILSLWALKKRHSVLNWLFLALTGGLFLFSILGTLARGAWVALAITTLLMLIVNRLWLLTAVGIVLGALLFVNVNQLPNNQFLQFKLTQTNSGLRLDNGTQGAAFDLILESPIKGYGYGNRVYHQVYNQQVNQHPNWVFKESIGPHNSFLAFWFAGGILGLIAIVYFCLAIILQSIQLIRNNPHLIRQSTLIVLMSFIGMYVLRGLFENAYINQVGILVGLLFALRYTFLADKTVPEKG